MPTVFVSGLVVKRDLTSKETNLYPSSKSLRGRLLKCENVKGIFNRKFFSS